jgi:signal transduction histidine kinase
LMKITTRIISGYGLFIAILAALVIYQVITINRMQEINKTLRDFNFETAMTCLQAMRDLDLLADRTRRLPVKWGDPDYQNALQESRQDFQKTLNRLNTYAISSEEKKEVLRLSQQWNAYNLDIGLLQNNPSQNGTSLPESLQADLQNLSKIVDTLNQKSLDSMKSKAKSSKKAGETAVLVLSCATGFAFVISVLVSLLIVRSISKPLAHLTDGTRAIADGKFFYRLDTTRNDEFSQLASDFNKMTLRLNELDELKKDFVSHVSHELKAPLASMRETIQLMLDGIPGPLTDKQKRLLELNLQSGKRLTSMITNLLDLSRTEAGVMEYELKIIDLVSLIRNAIAELEVQANERQIQIRVSVPDSSLLLECDGDRIIQVFLNVIGNAVKFSPKNSEVQVAVAQIRQIPEGMPERWLRLVRGAGKPGNFTLVTVADSGPGIQDSEKENVFEKFHQVKQRRKLTGQGVGLGLSICRTIMEAHRGAIWVENNTGGGSRFMVLLAGNS